MVNSIRDREKTYKFQKGEAKSALYTKCVPDLGKTNEVKEGSRAYSVGVRSKATIVCMKLNAP